MAKCVKCNEFLPPNYTEEIQGANPDLDGNIHQQCIFCKLQISEVERETSNNSGKYISYTKEQCIKDYKEFLNKLRHSRNVKDILNKPHSVYKP